MSILARFAPATCTAEQYDESMRRLQEQGHWPPDGLDYHVCFGPEEKIRVSEIWDSQEQFEAFGPHLMPLLEEIGIDPGQPELIEIHNVVKR